MQTLTKSGAGILLQPEKFAEAAGDLHSLLDDYRFVVGKRALRTTDEAIELMSRFGPLNETENRKDGTVMVEENVDEAEVFRSRFPLPLHKDGVLTGSDVAMVGIYCATLDNVSGGRTYVTDGMKALETVPQDCVAELKANGLEGMAVDTAGHYRTEFEGVWNRFPAFYTKPNGRETLSVGMPHAPGEPESWRVRVANVSEERSNEILGAMRASLLHNEFTYFHDWELGDILLIDNCEVLHGREAWEGTERQLANIQVLTPPGQK